MLSDVSPRIGGGKVNTTLVDGPFVASSEWVVPSLSSRPKHNESVLPKISLIRRHPVFE